VQRPSGPAARWRRRRTGWLSPGANRIAEKLDGLEAVKTVTRTGDLAQERAQTLGVSRPQARSRLVEHEHLWLHGQGPGNLHYTLVNMRQRCRRLLQRSGVAHEGK